MGPRIREDNGGAGGSRTAPIGDGQRNGIRAPTRDAPTEGAKMGPRIREDNGGDGRFANRPYRGWPA